MKIFLGEKSIKLSDHLVESTSENDKVIQFNSKKKLKKVLQEFAKNEKARGLTIYSGQDKELKSSFLSLFKIVEAAGGLVKNEKGESLFIFRRGKWDLPKGKIIVRSGTPDPPLWQIDQAFPRVTTKIKKEQSKIKEPYDKAAIREVMEETGLLNISIVRQVGYTYHIYVQRGKWILKPTIWFEMFAPGNQPLIPEEKEDISEVRWFNRKELPIINGNTYATIRELLLIAVPPIDPPGI
jgi:8-oxo-dGTP pyrophosphatase MutT (NUDIX family)